MGYPRSGGRLGGGPDFPGVERGVLEYWEGDGTFQASVEQRAPGEDGANEFVFYDGPPFANGLPHYGHLLTGYVKDVVPRYQTMRGRRVERRFGWDTHGLPAELEAQRVLGLKTKAEILELGIEKFNEACRASVLKYTDEWRSYVTRQARWVDFDNDYKTLNPDYMESVIWAFKTLYDKGLVYEGLRVLPYCWNDETPLSNHELRMDDDVYQPRQDPSVTVAVELETGERLLAWTTTPWTLPSNLAMAVGPEVDYAVVEVDGRPSILAEARLAAYGYTDVIRRLKGSELIGLRYTPLFDFFADTERWGTANAFQVIAAEHVTTDEGTGVVHLAPAYGEEDQIACEAVGIPTLLTVDDGARFTSVVPPYQGLHVFEANRPIIRDLRASGALVREDSYVHSYPHCWRCRNPLIYKAVSSWFVEVTRIRDRMVELNEQITWVPEHVKHGQFGKWLSNARDWSISRNRFWGSPIPVWRSDDPAYPRIDVYGSIEELERDFGVAVPDLHRPYVDQLSRPNPDDPTGRSTMRRVPDVLDVWFDSGSMSFAQVHYPFENTTWFEHHFPGDFIVEYIGQTRGWFYTLHVLSTALFDRPAFSSCLSHGIVLGNDGQKMSKSLRNYPDVTEVFDRDGADAMRWFLMSSPILRGGNLVVTEQGIRDGVRQVLIPLWNAWYFFALYANAAGASGSWSTASTDLLDRYLLARLRIFVGDVQERLDRYDIASACDAVNDYLEVLTNWYIRRSRDRFWAGSADAIDTLYTALEVVCRTAAPLLPLVTEHVWRGLTGERSVHLTDWPNAADLPEDADLVARMDRVREICSVASSIRKTVGIRARQPLQRLTVAAADSNELQALTPIISAEVNVREVVLTPVDAADAPVSQRLTVNARAAGPRLGRDVQLVIKASKSGDWSVSADGVVVAGGIELAEGEYTLEITLAEGGTASGLLAGGGFVVLDTALTPELEAEGVARDVIRSLQQARRDAGLDVTDRVRFAVTAPAEVVSAVEVHRELIMGETLAVELALAEGPELRVEVNP
ncbi:isoleucine--tRNA ligase [Kribbella sp. NPDC050124]|uniref:isoleucine--tRNA ligase n=1 Tax=Kribbella sp. NPDC050124 TaxID=3364114 RepID=UPI0037920A0A